MLCRSMFFVLVFILGSSFISPMDIKDTIGFPETEENEALKNKENRQPVYAPSICPENELYYPGDQKDDWICDCRPAHIYHSMTDKCWPAFQQGPCATGEYLVLPTDTITPNCQKNPCKVNLYVSWNGNCERLGLTRPCSHLGPNYALGVNATTLVVSCVRLNLDIRFHNRFGDVKENVVPVTVLQPVLQCPPGCRRSMDGKCIPIK